MYSYKIVQQIRQVNQRNVICKLYAHQCNNVNTLWKIQITIKCLQQNWPWKRRTKCWDDDVRYLIKRLIASYYIYLKNKKMRGLYIIKIWIRTIRRKDIIETTPIRQFRSSPPIRFSPLKKNDGIRRATYLRAWAWKERMNKCRGLRMGATIVYIVVSWSSRFWPNQPSAIRVNSSSL